MNKKNYRWFYNHIHSRYYNLLMKWAFLPFGGEKKCRDHLISHIEFSENEKILDMCCGTGGSTLAILRRAGKGSEINGIDISSGQLRIASRNTELNNVNFVAGDAAELCFPDNYFDKIFITHALHEMTRTARLKALMEAGRVLKENGSVIVLELDRPESPALRLFFGFWFFYWLPFNFETPTRKDMFRYGLINQMEDAGFRNVFKISIYRGVLQIIESTKYLKQPE